MLSAPIINPVVYVSTYFAFNSTPYFANARMIVGFISSIVIGLIIYRQFKEENILKQTKLVILMITIITIQKEIN